MPSPGQELGSLDFHNLIGGPLIAVVNAQAQAAVTTVNFIKAVGFQPLSKKKKFGKQETLDPVYVTFKYPKEVSPFQAAKIGTVTGISIINGGSGYAPGESPLVTIGAGGGTGATATATVSGGAVTSITITNPGSGYSNTPALTVTIAAPVAGGTAATASGTVDPKAAAVAAQFQMMALQVPMLSMLPVPYIRIEDVKLDFNAKIDSTETFEIDQSLEYDQSFDQSLGLNFGSVLSYSANFKSSLSLKESLSKGTEVNRTYNMAIQVHAVQAEVPAGLEKILNILQTAMISYPDGKAPQLKA
jgi:hypothetical protein